MNCSSELDHTHHTLTATPNHVIQCVTNYIGSVSDRLTNE